MKLAFLVPDINDRDFAISVFISVFAKMMIFRMI